MEQRDTAEALRRENERLRSILDNVVEGIVMIDDQGTIHGVNRVATRMFGYLEHEMVGRPVAMLTPRTRPGEEQRSLRHHLKTGGEALVGRSQEVTGLRRSGEEFPVELSVGAFSSRGRAFYTAIVRDITERLEIDRLKSEFVSVVSHELRTPLTSIRGSLGLIQGGAAGEIAPAAKEMIGIACSNTDRLIRLINDILDLDKIESRKIELQVERLRPAALVRTTLEGLAGYARERGVTLETRIEDERAVDGDADRLVQVLTNLLSNAINHSGIGAAVTVAVADAGAGRLRISVEDRGGGVPLDQQERIFEKFHQADASDTRTRGGTGLGLPIARGIVEQHGGTIGVESAPGEGSTFWFDLAAASPADSVHRADDPALEAGPVRGEPADRGRPRARQAPPDAGPATGRPVGRPLTVLIVDADEAARRVIAAQLSPHGVRCVEAPDGEAAVAAARVGDPDLVVTDVGLPLLDGYGLVQELRRGATRDVPLVVYSGMELDAASRARLTLGPTRFLVRSKATPDDFVATVLDLLPELEASGVVAPERPEPVHA